MDKSSINPEIKQVLLIYLRVENPSLELLVIDLVVKAHLKKADAEELAMDFYSEYLTPEKKMKFERQIIAEVANDWTTLDFIGDEIRTKPFDEYEKEMNEFRVSYPRENISEILFTELVAIIEVRLIEMRHYLSLTAEQYSADVSKQVEILSGQTTYLRFYLLLELFRVYNPTSSFKILDELSKFVVEKLTTTMIAVSAEAVRYGMKLSPDEFSEVFTLYNTLNQGKSVFEFKNTGAQMIIEFTKMVLKSNFELNLLFTEKKISNYAVKVVAYSISDYEKYFLKR